MDAQEKRKKRFNECLTIGPHLLEEAKFLHERGVDLDSRGNRPEWPLLHQVILSHNQQGLVWLLQHTSIDLTLRSATPEKWRADELAFSEGQLREEAKHITLMLPDGEPPPRNGFSKHEILSAKLEPLIAKPIPRHPGFTNDPSPQWHSHERAQDKYPFLRDLGFDLD